jgi:ABC-2 type transport system ATP-binding protein
MKAVVAEGLVKRYGKGPAAVEALQGLSFEVAAGELFGLIGPDGAGKTSLFRLLTTLLLPDGGRASVAGYDVVKDFKAIRQRVGYMPGRFSLYPDLTVAENLEFFATIFHTTIEANYDLIRDIYVQIEPFRDRRAGKLSGGMKQKLALCCALIHKPEVLFLDEPTTGVDAVSRKEFWDMLQSLKKQGITILVSTPYMDEASLCERVALIQSGRLLTIDTPEGVTGAFGLPLLAVRADQMFPLLQALQGQEGVAHAYAFGEYHHVVVQGPEQEVRQRLQSLPFAGLEVLPVRPGIEDCFISLMKN